LELFYLLRHGVRRVTRTRVVVASVITVASAFIGVSRARFPDGSDVLEASIFVALTAAGIGVVAHRWLRFRAACFTVLTIAGVLTIAMQSRGLANVVLSHQLLLREVHLTAEQQEEVDAGYVTIAQTPNAIASVGSARSLLLGWRSFQRL
jgi:hypothetical protein